MTAVTEQILKDLQVKGLFLIGGKGSGKTVMGKYLLSLAREKWGDLVDIKTLDPSLAWWHNSPLKYKTMVNNIHNLPTQSDLLYEVGKLDKKQLKELFDKVIGKEYTQRYDGVLHNPDYLNLVPLSLPMLEEAQDILEKNGQPRSIQLWVNEGRNFKMTGIFSTQRPAEVDTRIIERCNLLVGYIEGDNNKSKIEGATSKAFMDKLAQIKPKSHEFLYYNGEVHGPFKAEDLYYPSPVLVEPFTVEPERQEPSSENQSYQRKTEEPKPQSMGMGSFIIIVLAILFFVWMLMVQG